MARRSAPLLGRLHGTRPAEPSRSVAWTGPLPPPPPPCPRGARHRRWRRRIGGALFVGGCVDGFAVLAIGVAATVLALRLFGIDVEPHPLWCAALACPSRTAPARAARAPDAERGRAPDRPAARAVGPPDLGDRGRRERMAQPLGAATRRGRGGPAPAEGTEAPRPRAPRRRAPRDRAAPAAAGARARAQRRREPGGQGRARTLRGEARQARGGEGAPSRGARRAARAARGAEGAGGALRPGPVERRGHAPREARPRAGQDRRVAREDPRRRGVARGEGRQGRGRPPRPRAGGADARGREGREPDRDALPELSKAVESATGEDGAIDAGLLPDDAKTLESLAEALGATAGERLGSSRRAA